MTVPQSALVPFFRAMKTALGAQAAATRVSVAGCLFMQKLGLRNTNVSLLWCRVRLMATGREDSRDSPTETAVFGSICSAVF